MSHICQSLLCCLCWGYENAKKTVIPDPRAVWCHLEAGWWWPIVDFSIAMATTIREDNTDFDHAFVIGAGNVERQIHTSVVPYRRSDQSTHSDNRNVLLKAARGIGCFERQQLLAVNKVSHSQWKHRVASSSLSSYPDIWWLLARKKQDGSDAKLSRQNRRSQTNGWHHDGFCPLFNLVSMDRIYTKTSQNLPDYVCAAGNGKTPALRQSSAQKILPW